ALTLTLLASCSGKPSGDGSASADSVKFVTTQDGSAIEIKSELFDTPVAKEFLATGKNTYIGNADAVTAILSMLKMQQTKECLRQSGTAQTVVWVLKVKV
ncbi:MAG: hypothetical protein RLZZ351_808, partial [Pseudomonadota bacterium]